MRLRSTLLSATGNNGKKRIGPPSDPTLRMLSIMISGVETALSINIAGVETALTINIT